MRFRGKDLLERRSYRRAPIPKNFQYIGTLRPSSARNAAGRRHPAFLGKHPRNPQIAPFSLVVVPARRAGELLQVYERKRKVPSPVTIHALIVQPLKVLMLKGPSAGPTCFFSGAACSRGTIPNRLIPALLGHYTGPGVPESEAIINLGEEGRVVA
jgi:hypothetical protein